MVMVHGRGRRRTASSSWPTTGAAPASPTSPRRRWQQLVSQHLSGADRQHEPWLSSALDVLAELCREVDQAGPDPGPDGPPRLLPRRLPDPRVRRSKRPALRWRGRLSGGLIGRR